ncbi:SDR family NAD(P)-dependent oxidoreductase [Sorangium sp. So ce726]|uniref:SDR family NAD(P)-dependent oxidoreductase n=1 Tax=Sorangium sp. So ce726 TaxID=3133319 RepID=UPI003F6416F5
MNTPRRFSIDPEEFAGKRVLVTGGTKGAGEAIVRRLGAGGAVTATTARSALPEGQSPNVFVQADLATVAGVDAVVRALLGELGGIDILVHTVGGSSAPGGGFASLTEDIWQDELSLNLMAAVRLDRALLPHMITRIVQTDAASRHGSTQALRGRTFELAAPSSHPRDDVALAVDDALLLVNEVALPWGPGRHTPRASSSWGQRSPARAEGGWSWYSPSPT